MPSRTRKTSAHLAATAEPLEARRMLAAEMIVPIFPSAPAGLTNVNGALFFTASDGVNGIELWKSDGTPAGTVMVRDIVPGPTGSTPSKLTAVGNTLFFVAYTPSTGNELWKSDGTAGGTVMLKDISGGYSSSSVDNLTNVNGRLFFTAFNAADQSQVWQSDGTSSGTRVVSTPAGGAWATRLVASGNRVYWKENDTVRVYDRSAGTVSTVGGNYTSPLLSPSNRVDINGTLFFVANDAAGGSELWKASGATASRVVDLTPGSASTYPETLTNVNGTLMFWADDGQGHRGLWKSNGTAAGTTFVKTVDPFVNRAAAGNTLFFTAGTGAAPADDELWKSDGTAAGTVLLRDTWPGPLGGSPAYYAVAGSNVYFIARDMVWRSDGTTAGTIPVARTNISGSSFPLPPTVSGQYAYFGSSIDGSTTGLWRVTTQAGASVSGNLLNDRDGDAVRDASEDGLFGRIIYDDADDDGLPDPYELRTVTDDDGNYRLDGLAAATYRVRQYLPPTWHQTAPAGGAAQVVTLAASQSVTGRNFAAQGIPLRVLDARFEAVPSRRAVLFDFEANSPVAPSVTPDDVVVVNRDTGQTVPASSISMGTVPGGGQGMTVAFQFANPVPAGNYTATLRKGGVGDLDGYALSADYEFDFVMTSRVAGRRLFYNNSTFDGRNPAANAADDAAIAMDKNPLSATSRTPVWGTFSTYSRGLNGLMVDLAGMPAGAGLSAADFDFGMGNSPDGALWTAAPAPSGIAVRRGAGPGGADRVTLVWPDGAIKNTWLRVTVKPTARTGLGGPDVFFFGSYPGEVGPIVSNPRRPPPPPNRQPSVDGRDVLATLRAISSAAAPVTSAFDFNRDGKVTAADVWVVREALYVKPLGFFELPLAAAGASEPPATVAETLLR
jgi:ELWxxDGT repeat protein